MIVLYVYTLLLRVREGLRLVMFLADRRRRHFVPAPLYALPQIPDS